MNSKLTLTIDESVVRKAKNYAKKRGRSLSGIIENYLKAVTRQEPLEEKISPIVKKLKGAFSAPDDYDYKKELDTILAKKYFKKGEKRTY